MAITVNGKPNVDLPAIPPQKIAQVLSATTSSATTLASSGWTNLTGFSVTITPTSATSKILVMTYAPFFFGNSGGTQYNSGMAGVARNGTLLTYSILGQYYASSTTGTHIGVNSHYSVQYLDSPATTSPVTYTLQGNNVYPIPVMTGNSAGSAGQIIVMEILA